MRHLVPIVICCQLLSATACGSSSSPPAQGGDDSDGGADAALRDGAPASDAAAGDAFNVGDSNAADGSTGGLVWPNATSWANSDPWISAHHDAITEMHPRILAINFVNEPTTHAKFESNVREVIAALEEGSRYHGYKDPGAAPFVVPEIFKLVDLSDGASPPPGWNHLNSSKYPLKCVANAPYQFDYSALFGAAFADDYGVADPANPGKNLDLCGLIRGGMVHEVWLHVDGDPDAYTCPNGVQLSDFQLLEVVEAKQKYDAQGLQLPGQFDGCAGNGCYSQDDYATVTACGRSVRILYVNGTRGPGCAVHSLGHGFESTARGGSIAYLTPNFLHFANFDLKTRLNLPFDDWYACSAQDCVTFTADNALGWNAQSQTGTVAQYDQGCGSVHFAPNARAHYDDQNTQSVLSTCEHFGLKDGPGGADAQEAYTNAKSGKYDAMVPDCEGGWQVYWRQSFPGVKNPARGADGRPMKNWWPYLYY